MKKLKAILALVLVACLFTALFAACATSESGGDASTSNQDSGASNSNTPSGNDADKDTDASDEVDEIVTVNFYLLDEFMREDFSEPMKKELNAYLNETYGLNINFTMLATADWRTKMQMSIGGGDQVDLMALCVGNGVQAMYNNNMLMDIKDLAAEYAPDALEVMADYMNAYTIGGGLYGFPANRPLATNRYIVMRKDYLEELGMVDKALNMNSWSEYEEIMQAVTDRFSSEGVFALTRGNGFSTMIEYLYNGDSWDDMVLYDNLGDTFYQIYTDEEGNVSWLVDDPRFEEKLVKVAGWAEKGYIWPDSAYAEDQGHDLMKNGVSFQLPVRF